MRSTTLAAFALLAISALPMGACSTHAVRVSEEVGEDALPSPPLTPVVDQSAVRELRIVVQSEDGTLDDLGLQSWPVQTLDLIRTMPMSELVVNERGYAIAFSPAGPLIDEVNGPPEGAALDEVAFSLEGRLMWWVPLDDIESCPDVADESAFFEGGTDVESGIGEQEASDPS